MTATSRIAIGKTSGVGSAIVVDGYRGKSIRVSSELLS